MAESPAGFPPLLLVGRIVRAHGLRGEVGVALVGDDPARLDIGREVLFSKEKEGGAAEPRSLSVVSSRRHPRGLLVRFAGVETREQAELLAGGELSVRFDPSDLAPGEYYAHQLQGLDVRTSDGSIVGQVVGVTFGPGAPLLEISPTGVVGRTLLVPFHGDIVKGVDLAGGELTIDPPKGLLDL